MTIEEVNVLVIELIALVTGGMCLLLGESPLDWFLYKQGLSHVSIRCSSQIQIAHLLLRQ